MEGDIALMRWLSEHQSILLSTARHGSLCTSLFGGNWASVSHHRYIYQTWQHDTLILDFFLSFHQGVRERARVPQLVCNVLPPVGASSMLCWAHRSHLWNNCRLLCCRKTHTIPQHQAFKKNLRSQILVPSP